MKKIASYPTFKISYYLLRKENGLLLCPNHRLFTKLTLKGLFMGGKNNKNPMLKRRELIKPGEKKIFCLILLI